MELREVPRERRNAARRGRRGGAEGTRSRYGAGQLSSAAASPPGTAVTAAAAAAGGDGTDQERAAGGPSPG